MDKKLTTDISNNKDTRTQIKKSNTRIFDLYTERLRSDDEIQILQSLHDLSKELLVSNDQIAEDVGCQYLIKILIDLLDKFQHIPDIALNAIVCLNAFLDLNPLFTTTIVKNGGIPKIVMMTQNIEYIDIAENAIKGIEKISTENTTVLLENEALINILNLIDFFELSLRKIAIKTCVNITKSINSYEYMRKFVLPAIPSLSILIKVNGYTEIERYILDQSILCFYNIVHSIRIHNFSRYDSQIYNNLVYQGILNNLFEILSTFTKKLNNEDKTSFRNMSINIDTFKNIIKIFEILCFQSNDITNIVLNMNILEIIYGILSKEFDPKIKDKFNNSTVHIFSEIFSLIIALFPNTSLIKSEKDIKEYFRVKIMSFENKVFFIYFSQKILPILINNILSMPSTSAMLSVIRLIELYAIFSSKENIVNYISPANLSNIFAKLLDSKDVTYTHKILFIVDNLMACCPEHFVEKFIREGVIDFIKVINDMDESDLYGSDNIEKTVTYYNYSKYSKYYNQYNYEKEFYNNQFLYKSYDINKDKSPNDLEMIDEDKENNNLINIIEPKKAINLSGTNIKQKAQILEQLKKGEKIEIPKVKKEVIVKESEGHNKKVNDTVISFIKIKSHYLIDKYFSNKSKIEEYLKLGKCIVNPQMILNQLSKFAFMLKTNNVDENILNQIFDVLVNNANNMTFYEIEKSSILLSLCGYIDETFMYNLEKATENGNKLNISPGDDFLEKIKMIFTILNSRIKEFINILQNCISSMNCFKLCLNELETSQSSGNNSSFYKQQISLKLKINFHYVKNEFLSKDVGVDKYIKDLDTFYSNKNNITLYVEHSSTFSSISKILLTKCQQDPCYSEYIKTKPKFDEKQIDNMELESSFEENKQENTFDKSKDSFTENDNKKFFTNFYIIINDEKFFIDTNLSISDFIKEVKKLVSDVEFNQNRETQIYFEFIKEKELKLVRYISDKSINHEINSELFNAQVSSISNVEERLFFSNYSKAILANMAIYNIKRLSPFVYLLALIEMCVNCFSDLFFIHRSEKLNENILENKKVSTLLFKQVRDSNAISSCMIPSWCKDICHNLTYLANFNSRYLYFKTCSFDFKRSMLYLSNYAKQYSGEALFDDKTVSGFIKRKKFKVDRENILLYSEKIYNEVGNSDSFLDIEYIDETGTGNGPTLEFYSLFSKEIRQKLFWFRTSDLSLYPLPTEFGVAKDEDKSLFSLLGYNAARGLYDDRLLDMPLNSLFWDVVLERPISLSKISNIDKDVGNILCELSQLSSIKDSLLKENSYADLENLLLFHNKKISEMECYFILPGTNIELKEKGSHIQLNAYNFEEFLELVFQNLCGKGIEDYIKAFKAGFNKVFDINSLKCFKSIEIEEILSGSHSENWDFSTLTQYIIPNHGYNKNSLIYKYLISILSEMNNSERKQFLFFVTGCPRLPLGGFKNLNPKLTVVKKNPDQPMENPDNYLPTVMTCQNYLKIPEYSNLENFRKKLNIAMSEGFNTFHFS